MVCKPSEGVRHGLGEVVSLSAGQLLPARRGPPADLGHAGPEHQTEGQPAVQPDHCHGRWRAAWVERASQAWAERAEEDRQKAGLCVG